MQQLPWLPALPFVLLVLAQSDTAAAALTVVSTEPAFAAAAASTELLLVRQPYDTCWCSCSPVVLQSADTEIFGTVQVAFSVPWCSYCRELSPILENAEEVLSANSTNLAGVNLSGAVGFAEVDCERLPGVCAKHLPPKQRFPTVMLFYQAHQMLTYTGRREAQDIASFVAAYYDSVARFGVLPGPAFRLLGWVRHFALLNAVGGLTLATSSTRSLLRFSFALAAFSAVWCSWLVGCFFLGATLPTAVAIGLVCLIAIKLGG